MAKKKRQQLDERELTRKEERLRARDQERNRKLFLGTGIALGLALVAILIGAIMEFVVRPNAAAATVGEEKISTSEFRRRVLLERTQLLSRYQQLQLLEQQFGGQNFFANQIAQIESLLSNPQTLGVQVLDQLIDEKVVLQEAAKRDVTASDADVDERLREQIANERGFVTESQATATTEAGVEATATAQSFTPTPTPTIDISSTITATATAIPTPTARSIMTETTYTEGVTTLTDALSSSAHMSLEQYREVLRADLVMQQMNELIGEEDVSTTEEQVHARHILLRDREPTPTPTEVPADQPTPEPTATATELPEGAPTPTPTLGPRTREETLVEITDLRKRIVDDGEDFGVIAQEYSDDPGSGAQGGDLGWFGRGAMVAPFEEAAFSLPVGEVSEPISTTFGYHLIEVLEKDETRPKDESKLQQERSQAYQEWLQAQKGQLTIERPSDIEALLPPELRSASPAPLLPAQ
ncbi:MAG: peptidylprolyl isomerase [Caldilineaceae bacterium]